MRWVLKIGLVGARHVTAADTAANTAADTAANTAADTAANVAADATAASRALS